MISTKKTAAGWVIEQDGCEGGALVSGARAGRRVLYTRDQLAAHGIDYDSDPEGLVDDVCSVAVYLLCAAKPARVLSRGRWIR